MSDYIGVGVQQRKLGANVLLVRGLLAVALGIVAVVWPDITVKVFAVLMGILLVLSGVLATAEAFDRRRTGVAWFGSLVGGLALLAFGAAAILWPGPTVWALAVLFGLALVFSGAVIGLEAVASRREDPAWWLFLFWGVIAVGFGVIIVSWPDITIAVIVILKGIFWILGGIISLVASSQLRRAPTV